MGGLSAGGAISGAASGAAMGSAIPVIGPLLGGGIGAVLGLFGGKNKPTEYQLPMTKEDIERRKIWLNYIQNKIYNEPNRGQQAAGNSLDLMQGIYGRGMGGGQNAGMPQQGMSPYGAPQQNPYMDLFRQGGLSRPGAGPGGMPPTLRYQQPGMRMG
jgi:phage tail tape-measure protein